MPFLDFIWNRNKQQPVAQTSQKPKPETAKQMYTREDAVDRTSRRSIESLPEATKARAREVGALINKATQHMHHQRAQSEQPADAMDNKAAMRQNMTGQEQHSPALSPTSGSSGKTASERQPMNTPSKAREKTIQRTPPSWER